MTQDFVSKNGTYHIQVQENYGEEVKDDFIQKNKPLRIVSSSLGTFKGIVDINREAYPNKYLLPLYEKVNAKAEVDKYNYSLEKIDDSYQRDGYIYCDQNKMDNNELFKEKAEDAVNYLNDLINERVNKITLYDNKTKKVIASIDFAYPDIYDPENSTISQQINEINQLKFDSVPLDFNKQEFLPAKKKKGRYILQEMYRKEVEAERQDRIKNLRRKQGLER